MIDDILRRIEAEIGQSTAIRADEKAELLRLLAELKGEIARLARENPERAQALAAVGGASARGAGRSSKDAQALRHTMEGLASALSEFEESHPQLIDLINRISTLLANMGI